MYTWDLSGASDHLGHRTQMHPGCKFPAKEAVVKWSTSVIAGSLVMLAAACGSNAPNSATTTPSAADASTKPPAAHASTSATPPAPDLTAELLSVSDLPAGWSVVPSTDSSNSSTPKCLRALKTVAKATSKAETTFTDGSNGLPELDEFLVYLPGQGKKAMKLVSQILAGCGQLSMTSGGQTLKGTLGAMSFPAVAEQSFAYQLNLSATVSGLSVTVGIDLIVFRKADTVAEILYGDLGTPDISVLQPIVWDAAAKLPTATRN